ncbi:MAG: EF-P lysine aminoacylase GenX [Alphaproteobacteria bacterium]|nr:EF-P lysine aminoacylase GenX [Alphaproteobacteria bacterium]
MADRLPRLRARAAMTAAARAFFAANGFTEVETPALQVSPGMEPWLVAFETRLREPFAPGEGRAMYLHTSPEFAMKKLLAAGIERPFQLARAYRNAERSPTHHPEFTMLEWYRAGEGWRAVAADCEGLLRQMLAAAPAALRGGAGGFAWGGAVCDPASPWRYLSVAEAFARHAGVDVLATAPAPLTPDAAALAAEARRIGVHVGAADAWEDVFFRIFLERIEPHLGQGAPTVLYDWPISMAALARPHSVDPGLCERFELYVCGVELANGFGELTDADEQRRRFEADMDRKEAALGLRYPIDEDFLAALSAMPPAAGVALGFDRLAMLATGADRIEDVLWAPVAGGV